MGDGLVVEDGEVTDTGEDEIFQDRGRCSTARDDEHTSGFKGGLATGCPEAGEDG